MTAQFRGSSGWIFISLVIGIFMVLTSASAKSACRDLQAAIATGEIMPLDTLLARIGKDFPGRILKVDLECKGRGTAAVWIYEAEILTPKGHVLEVEYHTRTLDLLERRGE
jgi:uncharacterized membrane protein YkoI